MAHDMHDKGQPRRIMIVEDEALVAFELECYLTEAGYEVVGIADDLESALQLATEKAADLALVDIQLARGSSGRDVGQLPRHGND